MPYKIYKKNGYKVCKPRGKKCFSKKGLSKATAEAQQKALYAAEQTNEAVDSVDTSSAGDLKFVSVYPSTDEASVVYASKADPQVIVTLVYTLKDSFYPEYEYYTIRDRGDLKGEQQRPDDEGDPQSKESETLLRKYKLTPDDIEMAGQDAPTKISQHFEEESSVDSYEESLEFEKLFARIFANEKKS
jgi:hypothetical protein